MVGWTLLDPISKTPNRVYTRPLGITELVFYWDSRFSGTADTVQLAEVREEGLENIFSRDNLEIAWRTLKHHFPLLASRFRITGSGDRDVEFVVEEKRLGEIGGEEIQLLNASSLLEAQSFAQEIINGPRQLSDALPARVHILVRTDKENHYHILLHLAHSIADGIANATLLRNFLDMLAGQAIDASSLRLEERLASVVAQEDLDPSLILNIPRQRWRRAIGHVMCSITMDKRKGGHTIPRTLSPHTSHTPAQSCMAVCSLAPDVSSSIISNCRKNRLTFGNALPVFSQVALTRVLYRQHKRGIIDDEEWEKRRREPMHIAGPLNIRPFLNKKWFESGGGGDVCLSIGFFFYTLPFMPLGLVKEGEYATLDNGAPPFSSLLSAKRFILRSNLIKKQAEALLKHPLFLEINAARTFPRVHRGKAVFENYIDAIIASDSSKNLGVLSNGGSYLTPDLVFSHGGSSMGNMDSILPLEYPIPASNHLSPRSTALHSAKAGIIPYLEVITSDKISEQLPRPNAKPLLHLVSSDLRLRCRPGEIYLGAFTANGQLHLKFFWDGNVFDDATVREWLDEVKDSAVWYLG